MICVGDTTTTLLTVIPPVHVTVMGLYPGPGSKNPALFVASPLSVTATEEPEKHVGNPETETLCAGGGARQGERCGSHQDALRAEHLLPQGQVGGPSGGRSVVTFVRRGLGTGNPDVSVH